MVKPKVVLLGNFDTELINAFNKEGIRPKLSKFICIYLFKLVQRYNIKYGKMY